MKKLPAYITYLLLEGCTAFLFGMIFTTSSIYEVTVAHLLPLQLVLVGTTVEASIFLFEVPTGIVADAYSRRLSIIVGVFLTGLAFLIEGLFPIFGLILLAQVIWGLGYTFTSGATQAWITDEIGESKAGRAFLRASQVSNLAALFGIGIGTILGSLRVNIPIVTGGLLLLGLGGLMTLVMPETGFKPTPRESRNSWQHMAHLFREGLQMTRRRPTLLTILGIGLVYGLYSEGFDRLWTKLILDNFTFPQAGHLSSVVWLGLARGAAMLLAVGAAEWVRRRVNIASSRVSARALLLATATLMIGLLSFAWSGTFIIAALIYIAIMVTRYVIGPIYDAWVNQRIDPGVRATVLSMSAQVDALGQISGGPLVGLIGNLSVRAAITISGLLLAPALFLSAQASQGEEAPVTFDQPET